MYRGFKQDMIACMGEFIGTTMFIFLGLGCVKTAQESQTSSQLETVTTLSNETLMFISVGMGFSLLITAWVFYRITGGLFNPAVTLSLWLIGGLKTVRAILLVIAQFAGGIAGSALVQGLTAGQGVGLAITTLQPGMSYVRGTFLEAFLTAMLVFTVLMLAAEKHKATYLAPIGIGLTLFICQLFGTLWTGCGMNPARTLGPSVVSGRWPGYTWIYYVGPFVGSLIATMFYALLKAFDYTSVVLGQDSDDASASPNTKGSPLPTSNFWHPGLGYTRQQRTAMLASGMHPSDIERAEADMVNAHAAQMTTSPRPSDATLINMTPERNGQISNSVLANKSEKPPARKGTKTHKFTGTATDTATGQPMQGSTGRGGKPDPNASTMQPAMQDSGGMAAPGAHTAGISTVPIVKKILRHPNHDAHR